MGDNLPSNSEFDREKWLAEHQLKKDELALKGRELDIRENDSKRARWTNPLVLAIAGGALAAGGNVVATYYTGVEQRTTESAKHRAEQEREREKAESQLILEVIKTANPDKAAENLNFLVETSLINDGARRTAISSYVNSRPPGTGVSLPVPAASSAEGPRDLNHVTCLLKDVQNISNVKAGIEKVHADVRWRAKTEWRTAEKTAEGDTRVFYQEGILFRVSHQVRQDGADMIVRTSLRMEAPKASRSGRDTVEDFWDEMYNDFHHSLAERYVKALSPLTKVRPRCFVPKVPLPREIAGLERLLKQPAD